MGILDKAIANSVPAIPRPVVRRISRRYIAGDTLEEAVAVVRDLNRSGCVATIDVLGESTESKADAARTLRDYEKVIDALDEHDLESGISVKLTGLGLTISEELCRANLEEIVAYAAGKGPLRQGGHGGLALHRRHAGHGHGPARALRERRGRDPGLHAAQPRRRGAPHASRRLCKAVQGHLRRAAHDSLQGLRYRARELQAAPRGAPSEAASTSA